MPVMNGLEAAPRLKQILPNTPIIMFTMFGDTLPQSTMQAAGVNMVVSKNESLDTLIEKARSLFPD